MSDRPPKGAGARAGGERGAGWVAFLLAQVGAHAAARFAERLAPLGLAPQHAGILRLVAVEEGSSQRALGERLGILPSRLVALVDELEAKGLLERRNDPQDRRSHALHLTVAGRARLADIGRVAHEHGDALCSALDEGERRQLATLLSRIGDQQGLAPGIHPGFKERP